MTSETTPERWGNVKISTIRRDFDRLRACIRNWDAEETEKAWDKCERWLGALDRQDARNAEIERLRGLLRVSRGYLSQVRGDEAFVAHMDMLGGALEQEEG